MALSYTRLICRRGLDIRHFRGLYTSSPLRITTSAPIQSVVQVHESHDERNMRLKRPMSPHMSIYQTQLTWVLSISHRTTGMILSGYAVTAAVATLFTAGGVPGIIAVINAWGMPLPLLFAAKTLLALPATFHYFNGIRHLAWDVGQFLTLKDVYVTGWAVVGASALSAIILACL